MPERANGLITYIRQIEFFDTLIGVVIGIATVLGGLARWFYKVDERSKANSEEIEKLKKNMSDADEKRQELLIKVSEVDVKIRGVDSNVNKVLQHLLKND